MVRLQIPENAFNALEIWREERDVSVIHWSNGVIVSDELLKRFKDLFNIEKDDSSFIAFYAAAPFPIMNENGPELLSLNDIRENSSSEYFTDFFTNPSTVKKLFGTRFFVLTSGEGGSYFFYDSKTDGVYDSDKVRDIEADDTFPAPKWSSFYDFIESYYGDGVYS